jgi:hypothetical protein
MAIDIHQDSQLLGLLKQANWATPSTASSNFETVPYHLGNSLPDPDIKLDEIPFQKGGSLSPNESRSYIDPYSGLPKVPFTVTGAKALIARHLVAAYQNITEAATTPFAKSLRPQDAMIDFAADAGFLWSIAGGSYDSGSVGDGWILENALINDFKLSCNPNGTGQERLLKIEGNWIGNNLQTNQHFTGTWVTIATGNMATAYLNDSLPFTVDLSLGGDSILSGACFEMFELNHNNNIFAKCKGAAGKALNYHRSGISDTAVMDIPYTSATYKVLNYYKTGANVSFAFYNGTGLTDGLLKIAFTKGRLTANPMVVRDKYLAIRLQIEILKPTAGWTGSEILYADTLDGAY